jgi:hypothetical protein
MERHELPDYYEVLQVSRRADPLIITKAYRLLAALYHPDNKETADEEKFRQVVDAYRELVDPVRRAAYERAKFPGNGCYPNGASGSASVTEAPPVKDRPAPDERQLRRLLLHALYNIRRHRPYRPGVPLLVIAELFGCSIEETQFTLWYLRGKKLIEITDDDGIAITVTGVDHLEANDAEPVLETPDLLSLPEALREIPMRPEGGSPGRTSPGPR